MMTPADRRRGAAPGRPRDDQDREAGTAAEAELSIGPDTVAGIIALARDVMGKSASTEDDDADIADDDPELAILEDRPGGSSELQLRSLLADLDDEKQIDLVALLWLGRDGGEWQDLRALAAQEHNASTADYLCGTPLLGDYLAAGLDTLGRARA